MKASYKSLKKRLVEAELIVKSLYIDLEDIKQTMTRPKLRISALKFAVAKSDDRDWELQIDLEAIYQELTVLKSQVSALRSTEYNELFEETKRVQQLQKSHYTELLKIKETSPLLNPEISFKTGIKRLYNLWSNSEENDSFGNEKKKICFDFIKEENDSFGNEKKKICSDFIKEENDSFGNETKKICLDFIKEENDSFGNEKKKICFDFIKEKDFVVVYTDGSCKASGLPKAKAGIGVWWGDNHPLNVAEPLIGKPDSNMGEMQACTKAMNVAVENGVTKLMIKTDSRFVINTMGRMRSSNGKFVPRCNAKTRENYQNLYEASLKLRSLKWVHVKGHFRNKGNNSADRLAKAGAAKYRGYARTET